MKRHLRNLAIGLGALVFVAFIGIQAASIVHSSQASHRYVCEQINRRAIEPLRGLLQLAQSAATRNPLPPGLTDEQRAFYNQQRAQADKFYADAVALVAPIDCAKA